MLGVGEGNDSEGSEWIIKVLKEDDERPLWIATWGGVNTLAQALYKISHTMSKAEARRLLAKLRVYTISDQDDSGIWIRNNFPELFYIVSTGDDYGSATWSAINSFIQGINNEKISNTCWLSIFNRDMAHLALNIPMYLTVWKVIRHHAIFDTNGLNVPEHPEFGGWGGRYELYKPDFAKYKKGNSGTPNEPRQELYGRMPLTLIPHINPMITDVR